MRFAITNFIFGIGIFVSWFVPAITNSHFAIENYVDKELQHLCENDKISVNFSNTVISNIGQNFISSSVITCLNLMGNNIENIGRNAFNKLPNLTRLFLSNNNLYSRDLFSFGGHNKLQVLVMNSAASRRVYYSCDNVVQIFDEYPNLETLSFRKNCFNDFEFYREEISPSELESAYTMVPIITQKVHLFPKLKILDLSENAMRSTNFVKMLPNSLLFLDLHDNSLNSLDLNEILNELVTLNLNNNRFNYISNWHNKYSESLSVAGLTNIRYLSISGNEINVIESGAFQNNNKLLYLNLSANSINNLHSKTFANLNYLQILDLSNNKLENVLQVSNETEINTLYINYNKITTITSHAFMQMPKLTTLLMGQNLIDEIDVNAFINLSVLQELDLSLNKLSSLPEGWAKPLVSLKYLDLSKNIFTSLESLSIPNALPVIEILYLMENPLQHLNVRYFENLSQNLTVNLSDKSSFAKWILRSDQNLYG